MTADHASLPSRDSRGDGRVLVLLVCTANLCRSPLAERLLVCRMAGQGRSLSERFRVESAGIAAVVGRPMHPLSERELRLLGGDSAGFRSRQLTTDMVKRASLVLTATRRHKSVVLSEHAWAHHRCFTLREFDALTAQAAQPSASMDDLVDVAARSRGVLPLRDYDVPDPIRGGPVAHRAAAQLIDASARRIAAAFSGLARVG